MPTTLKEAINSIKSIQKPMESKENISNQFLGKYQEIIPPEKNSTVFIKELRASLYEKVK